MKPCCIETGGVLGASMHQICETDIFLPKWCNKIVCFKYIFFAPYRASGPILPTVHYASAGKRTTQSSAGFRGCVCRPSDGGSPSMTRPHRPAFVAGQPKPEHCWGWGGGESTRTRRRSPVRACGHFRLVSAPLIYALGKQSADRPTGSD